MANNNNAINRLDEYAKIISVILTLTELARKKSHFVGYPEDFQIAQKRSWDTILYDIKSLDYETKELASRLADLANQKKDGSNYENNNSVSSN